MSINSFREDEEQKQVFKLTTLGRLYKYLLSYGWQIFGVLLLMGVIITISLVNPLLIEKAVNEYVAQSKIKELLIVGAVAIVINITAFICLRLRLRIMAKMQNRVLVTIRNQLYRHIQTLGFGFFDSRPTGKILARVIGDVNSLRDVLSDSVTTLIPDFLTIVAVAVLMIVKNARLALASLLTIPFLIVGMCLVQIISHKRWQTFRKKNSNLNAFVHEDLSGIKVIQSFGAEADSMKDFGELSVQLENSFIGAVKWADAFGPITDTLWSIGTCLLYYSAVKLVGIGDIEIGTIIAFSTYMGMFWNPIRNLSNFYNKLITNISAAERIFDILDTEPELADKEGVIELPEIKGTVEFKNVSFAYADEKDKHVLNDVSFSVSPGETIALVGPTGAGKTTIVNLISRFYDIEEGDILIDGYSLKDVSIESLRKQMGVMTQDNFIFSGTVRENILYGKLDATDEEMISAAKATGAHDFIMKMEKGYDTELSQGGSNLSIGQRQLLAFARTMISQPRVLILDEATSSIDTHTELLVQAGIASLLQGRTSFVIAHRLSTIKNASRIFVIDHGIICEAGSHDELMEKKGAYYELYMAQFKSLVKKSA